LRSVSGQLARHNNVVQYALNRVCSMKLSKVKKAATGFGTPSKLDDLDKQK
jgi:hypothetical protein